VTAQLAVKAKSKHAGAHGEAAWEEPSGKVLVGKDILELLSSSMYVDPMTIYREYVQNAADALDDAHSKNKMAGDAPRVEIAIDPQARTIRIRDNGIGLPANDFAARLSNLGASTKRGTNARGFRGVGRLAGLGYCQELIFRSRASDETSVSEMRWDCKGLKASLRSSDSQKDLSAIIREVVSVRRVAGTGHPTRFFEVELKTVVRHRNDRLLNPSEVGKYLSQVAPVPFAPSFRYATKINEALAPYVALGDVEIYINGAERPLYRPHRNRISVGETDEDRFADLEIHKLSGIDGEVSGVAWILHHGYTGALPNEALIKGVRLRVGNVQVGDHVLLEELFPEPRFNSWAVGEVHVFDRRVVPNGRRDHFEQNVHFDNILNQLGPMARDIARRCRQSSIARKWLREFELQKEKALLEAKAVGRRGLSSDVRDLHARAANRALGAIEKVIEQRHLEDEARKELQQKFAQVSRQVATLLANRSVKSDPYSVFRPQARRAYRDVVELIYELNNNGAAASRLVEMILTRLEEREKKTRTSKGVKRKCSRR
jgi:molecular chaperone HtpG